MKTAYTDGACRVSNPGETSCAFVVYDDDGEIMGEGSRYLGPELHTNNYAEYRGLIELLMWAERNKVVGLEIYCDSALIVNQVMDVWDVNSEDLRTLHYLAYTLRVRGAHYVQHIKGHAGNPGNEYADKLCNEVLDREGK